MFLKYKLVLAYEFVLAVGYLTVENASLYLFKVLTFRSLK